MTKEIGSRTEDQPGLTRPKLFRAKDPKLSTTGARVPLRKAIPISDIGIRSTMLQATTEATLCLTTDNGAMVMPTREWTSDFFQYGGTLVGRTRVRHR